MAEEGERPQEGSEDSFTKDQDNGDSNPSRGGPLMSRRVFLGGAGLTATGAALAGTPTGRRWVRTGLERLGILDKEVRPVYELPPLPEFQLPDRDQRVLVIPILDNNEQEVMTSEEIQAFLESVALQYRHYSFGKLDFSFKVLAGRNTKLPADRDDPSAIASIADATLSEDELKDVDLYQTRLYILSPDKEPQYGGVAFSPIGNNRYNRAIVYADKTLRFLDVARHELGHTLGLPHANSVNTKGKILNEYITSGNAMGDSKDTNLRSLNVPQRVSMGWVEKEQIQDVTKNGVFKINNVELGDYNYYPTAERNPITLRIQKPDTNERYYVGYRNLNGITQLEIDLWDEKLQSSTKQVVTGMSKWTDGGEYYDRKNGIKIKQVSHVPDNAERRDSSSVMIQVTFDKK